MPAFAQGATTEDNSGGIEEIVVTAQKRAESAQEVPIAISVFSGDSLAERAVTLGGTNLTDPRYVTAGSSIPVSGVIDGNFSRPREWYARVGFKF